MTTPNHHWTNGPTTVMRRERVSDLWAELRPLTALHWAEITSYPDIPLDVNEERYDVLEESGWYRLYTARIEGELVGYAAFLVAPSLHYRSSKQAIGDVVFVVPAHRGHVGRSLLAYAERQLRLEGVQVVSHHQKVKHAALGKVLEHDGYEHTENIWSKRLDKGD